MDRSQNRLSAKVEMFENDSSLAATGDCDGTNFLLGSGVVSGVRGRVVGRFNSIGLKLFLSDSPSNFRGVIPPPKGMGSVFEFLGKFSGLRPEKFK